MKMANTPFFTVIMPVYNAVPFVRGAAESILHQTFGDFELIMIEDHSSDDSWDICQKIKALDKRVILLRTERNEGASAARNKGLDQARGRYITFVDADDTIDADVLQKAAEELKGKEISCLKMGVSEEYVNQEGKKTYTKICAMKEGTFSAPEAIRKQIVAMEIIPLFGYLWNGFYEADIIRSHHLRLDPRQKVNEDFLFNIDFFQYCQVLRCSDICGYHYVKGAGNSLSSQMKRYDYEAQMIKICSLLGLFPAPEAMPQEVRAAIFWMYARFVLALLVRAAGEGNYKEEWSRIREDELYRLFCETSFGSTSGKRKVIIALLRDFPGSLLKMTVYGIYALRMHCPVLFAKVKR